MNKVFNTKQIKSIFYDHIDQTVTFLFVYAYCASSWMNSFVPIESCMSVALWRVDHLFDAS